MGSVSRRRNLHRLLYASRQRIVPADVDDAVGEIIRASIRNNREAAITGLLLAHQGHFLQALEGPAEAVMTTYGRICNDRRHSDTKIISSAPAESRMFADWNMCARRITPADSAILDTLAMRTEFTPHQLTPASALRLLSAVRGIQARTQLEGMV